MSVIPAAAQPPAVQPVACTAKATYTGRRELGSVNMVIQAYKQLDKDVARNVLPIWVSASNGLPYDLPPAKINIDCKSFHLARMAEKGVLPKYVDLMDVHQVSCGRHGQRRGYRQRPSQGHHGNRLADRDCRERCGRFPPSNRSLASGMHGAARICIAHTHQRPARLRLPQERAAWSCSRTNAGSGKAQATGAIAASGAAGCQGHTFLHRRPDCAWLCVSKASAPHGRAHHIVRSHELAQRDIHLPFKAARKWKGPFGAGPRHVGCARRAKIEEREGAPVKVLNDVGSTVAKCRYKVSKQVVPGCLSRVAQKSMCQCACKLHRRALSVRSRAKWCFPGGSGAPRYHGPLSLFEFDELAGEVRRCE